MVMKTRGMSQKVARFAGRDDLLTEGGKNRYVNGDLFNRRLEEEAFLCVVDYRDCDIGNRTAAAARPAEVVRPGRGTGNRHDAVLAAGL